MRSYKALQLLNEGRAMVIKNDIGLCVVMPVRIEDKEDSIIVDVE